MGTVASQEGPSPYPVAGSPLAPEPTGIGTAPFDDATMDIPLPRERRATDAPRIPQNLGCVMFCLICGEPNLLEIQRDVCPLCNSQDCLIPNSCELSVRCQRSGRDAEHRRVYGMVTRTAVDARIAHIILRNSKSRPESQWLRDPTRNYRTPNADPLD